MERCEGCKERFKARPRSEQEIKSLVSRLNRIAGQIEDNRYCGEVLVQVSAAESAMRAFGYLILEEHLATCVSDKIRAGDESIVSETVELIKKLN